MPVKMVGRLRYPVLQLLCSILRTTMKSAQLVRKSSERDGMDNRWAYLWCTCPAVFSTHPYGSYFGGTMFAPKVSVLA